MDKQKFLAAAAKAAEIKLKCDATFAALRTYGDAERYCKQRAQDLERHIAEVRNNPLMRGRLDLRAAMRGQIAGLERERDEHLQEARVAQRLSDEYREESQRLAHQRDTTQEELKRLRVECDRATKVVWPDGVDEFYPEEKTAHRRAAQ